MKYAILTVGLLALAACSPDSADLKPATLTAPTGACMTSETACTIMTREACDAVNGTYQGDGTACPFDYNTDGRWDMNTDG